MNAPRPIPHILKHMLGFNRFGPWPLIGWLGLSTAGLVVNSVFILMQSPDEPDFMGPLMAWCCALWIYLMLAATALPFQALGSLVSLEFLFTRAIDKGRWLRTERVAVMIIALGPLVLNLALSPLSPRLVFDRAAAGSPGAILQQRYLETFPGSLVIAPDTNHASAQLVIRHGTEMFAAWMVWAGAVLTFVMAGYWSAVYTRWQKGGWHHSDSKWRPWLAFAMIQTPFLVLVALLVACAACRINPFEESFLLFARHPAPMTGALIALIVVVQPWTERNILKMEFEFL